MVQPGNVIAQYDLPSVPNVGKRVVNSNDGDNFAPRVGFAYTFTGDGRTVMRGTSRHSRPSSSAGRPPKGQRSPPYTMRSINVGLTQPASTNAAGSEAVHPAARRGPRARLDESRSKRENKAPAATLKPRISLVSARTW